MEQNPLFGIGFAEFDRPAWMISSSVDNHWLLLAIRFGALPSFIIFGVALTAVILLCNRTRTASELDRKAYVGLAIALSLMVVLGFSVAFFGGAVYWLYMLIAIAISLSLTPSTSRLKRVRFALAQDVHSPTHPAELAGQS